MGSPCLKELAEAYHAAQRAPLGSEAGEVLRVAECMANVSRIIRTRGTRRRGYGPKSRCLDRRIAQSPPCEPDMLAVMAGRTATELSNQHLSLAVQSANAGLSLEQVLQRMHCDNKGVLATIRAREEADVAALARWAETSGTEVSEALTQSRLLPASSSLVAVPDASNVVWCDASAVEDAVQTVASATECAPQLGPRLDSYWADQHVPEIDNAGSVGASSEPVASADADEEVPPAQDCHRIGFCVCKEAGKSLFQFRNWLLRCLKRAFPVNSSGRKALGDAYIVIGLVELPPEDCDGVAVDGGGALREVLWHIGFMLFSPYIPSVHRVERTSDPGELPPSDRRVYIKAGRWLPSLLMCSACMPRARL